MENIIKDFYKIVLCKVGVDIQEYALMIVNTRINLPVRFTINQDNIEIKNKYEVI